MANEPAPDSAAATTVPDPVALGARARLLMRGLDRATLATAQQDAAGWPYPSLTLVALDHDASPLLLISRLADHTRNLLADDRVGLLFDGTAGLTQPLTGPRLSVLGRAAVSDDPRHRARFLARHPGSAFYADFADFAIYRVTVGRVHLVAGFGRAYWLAGDHLLYPAPPEALAAAEADIVNHMNADHADAVQLYARVLLGADGDGDWTLTGVDPEGADLRRGGRVLRLPFDQPVGTAQEARAALVALVQRARAAG